MAWSAWAHGAWRGAEAALLAATLLAALLGPSAPTGRVAAQDEPPRVDAPDAPVQATCAPAETCAAITETDTTSTGWLAAPRQAAGPLGQGTGGAGPGDELASCSAVPALASALLRTRVDAGLLGARQSAVATLAPNAVALSRLAARLRSGEAVDASDPLVWLLTQQEAPRYPNNPFVTLTRDLRPGVQGDASYESLLAARIAATDTMLRPQDLLRLALDVAGGDYPLGTLIAHNLLKELAFASSAGGGALVAWSPTDRGSPDDARAAASPTYIVLSGDDVQALTGKLAPLRPADDPHPEDQQGPWYRLFGSLFVGALAGGSTAAASAGDALARWFRPDPSDPFLDQLTACGVQLAPLMAELSIADAAPDPALASPFAAPGALTSAPSDVGVSSPPFTAPASPAAPSSGRGAAIAAPPPAPSAPAVNLAAGAPVSYPPPVPYQPASVQPQVPPTVIPTPADVPGIRGVVRSAQTGQPLTGATVSAPSVGRSVTTDGVGSYQLTGLAPGAVQVRATASGFIADSVTVTVPPSGSVTQNFGL